MTNKITKVYKNGVEYAIYASGGAAGTGDVTGPSSSTDADIALFSGATGKIIKDSGKKLSDYQTALSTQTAYSAKGTTTKVPQITTNTLGQVTTITEKSIAFPVTSVNGSTGAVTGLQTTSNLKTSLSDNSDSYYPSQKAVKTAVDGKQATLVSGTNIKTVNGNSLLGSGDLSVGGITKIFTLSSTSDLTNAQAAYNWYVNGGNPIVEYGQFKYRVSRDTGTELRLAMSDSYGGNNLRAYFRNLGFTISSSSVTGITEYKNTIMLSSSAPTSGNNNIITLVI